MMMTIMMMRILSPAQTKLHARIPAAFLCELIALPRNPFCSFILLLPVLLFFLFHSFSRDVNLFIHAYSLLSLSYCKCMPRRTTRNEVDVRLWRSMMRIAVRMRGGGREERRRVKCGCCSRRRWWRQSVVRSSRRSRSRRRSLKWRREDGRKRQIRATHIQIYRQSCMQDTQWIRRAEKSHEKSKRSKKMITEKLEYLKSTHSGLEVSHSVCCVCVSPDLISSVVTVSVPSEEARREEK